MGYTYCGANALMGLFSQDDAEVKDYDKTVAKYDAWARFCETQKIKPNRHTGSLGNIIEKVIESIGLLQKSNSWLVDDVGKKYNFKKHCLDALKYAKTLEKDGYFSYLDLDKLINLIKKSASPIEAIDEIQKDGKLGAQFEKEPVKVSKIAHGIPIGVDMEYIDSLTLEMALENRTKVESKRVNLFTASETKTNHILDILQKNKVTPISVDDVIHDLTITRVI